MSSVPKEIQAVAAAHGALERLIVAVDDHLEHGGAGPAARAVTEANLRDAKQAAEKVARAVAHHAVESRDTTPSRAPSIITGAKRTTLTARHLDSPDMESSGR